MQHVTKSFGGVRAVHDCSFVVREQSITALIGPNGAGKSTVFNCIAGIASPDHGRVLLQHIDLTHLSVEKRAQRGLARTFQHVRLFSNLTVAEHVALVTSEIVKAYALLQQLGFDAPLRVRGSELSFGQGKLLALTLALMMPHTLLMLDEPVAGVNPVIRESLVSTLKMLKAQGETILLVEHDMPFVCAVADHVMVMDAGEVLTQGTPQEVLKDPRVLSVYLGEQL